MHLINAKLRCHSIKRFPTPTPTQITARTTSIGETYIWPKIQLVKEEDSTNKLSPERVNTIQKIIGKFYYYARAVDHTMLVALGELATKQTVGTATTKVAEDVVYF